MYYWPTTMDQFSEFISDGPWSVGQFFYDLTFGDEPSSQQLYNMALWSTPYIAANVLYPGHPFGLMRSAQVLGYGLTEAGITGAVARSAGPVGLAVAGSAAQHHVASKHGAGTRGSMGSVSPSLHGNWLQSGLDFNWPW